MKLEEMINKVHCADCLEFMKDLPDKSIDLVLTDPPYGIGKIWVGGKGSGWGKTRKEGIKRNKWDNETPKKRNI